MVFPVPPGPKTRSHQPSEDFDFFKWQVQVAGDGDIAGGVDNMPKGLFKRKSQRANSKLHFYSKRFNRFNESFNPYVSLTRISQRFLVRNAGSRIYNIVFLSLFVNKNFFKIRNSNLGLKRKKF